jgi:hypothetical protein
MATTRKIITPDPNSEKSSVQKAPYSAEVMEEVGLRPLRRRIAEMGYLVRTTMMGRLKQIKEEHSALFTKVRELSATVQVVANTQSGHNRFHESMHGAHVGDVEMQFDIPDTILVPIAELDASEQDWITKSVRCKLQSKDLNHLWITEFYNVLLAATDTFTGGQDASTGPASVTLKSGVGLGTRKFGGSGTWPASAKSTAAITCVAASAINNGETLTLIGNRTAQAALNTAVCEYRKDGGAQTAGRYLIAIDAADTAAQVATKTADVINGICHADMKLKIKATANVADVDLEQVIPGTDGDTVVADTVTDAGYLTPDFTGGAGDKVELTYSVESSVGAGDDKFPFGVAVAPVTIRLVGV